MTVRYTEPAEMIAWAAARLGGRYRDDAQAIGVEHKGELLAVAVFDTHSVRQCHVSLVAQPGRVWLTRGFARAVAAYVFLTCKYPRVTCQIPASYEFFDARRLAEHLGCKVEGQLREAATDGSDLMVYGLLRRECPWLPRTLI